MSDMISRQAAIEAVSQAIKGVFVEYEDIAKKMIGKLPSAESEIDFAKKIPFYRAKHINSDRYEDGFYFALPETTYCFTDDYERHPVKIHHFIINHRMSDWGLPNRTEGTEIDPNTLKFIGWFTVREFYGTESWVERDNNGN